ncbi:unnamed protein product, partial [Rotaria sp. Silwood1]
MFTYSFEILSSVDTSTTTTENTIKLGVNKDTWKIFTNFLTMNIDFYQYKRLNIDPHDDLRERNKDNHSIEDSPYYVMKVLKESECSKCFRQEIKMAKKLKEFNDLNKFHLFFQDILYSLSS